MTERPRPDTEVNPTRARSTGSAPGQKRPQTASWSVRACPRQLTRRVLRLVRLLDRHPQRAGGHKRQRIGVAAVVAGSYVRRVPRVIDGAGRCTRRARPRSSDEQQEQADQARRRPMDPPRPLSRRPATNPTTPSPDSEPRPRPARPGTPNPDDRRPRDVGPRTGSRLDGFGQVRPDRHTVRAVYIGPIGDFPDS